MSSYLRGFLAAIALFGVLAAPLYADNYEQYCDIKGFAAATRQTIVVLDERQVTPENGDRNDERNGPWRRFVGRLVDFQSAAQLEQRFQPRERLTLVLARKDGTGVTAIFTGCLPFFSQAEQRRAAGEGGVTTYLKKYFGFGEVASAKHDSDVFISRLGESIREAIQPDALSARGTHMAGNFASSGLIASLKQSPFVDLNRGLPRIILLSNLPPYFGDLGSDLVQARSTGKKLAEDAALNLRGSEIYVVGSTTTEKPYFRDAVEMFFLVSHASLISMGSFASVPDFLPPPTAIRRYQGLIQFPDRQYPIRIRLATDQNGTLVNSWLSVETSKEEFVPVHGTITCQADGCRFSGDNTFAQVWNPKHSGGRDPVFDPEYPFGGARILEFSTRDDYIRGDISDPHIKYQNLQRNDSKTNKLHFFANYSAGMF